MMFSYKEVTYALIQLREQAIKFLQFIHTKLLIDLHLLRIVKTGFNMLVKLNVHFGTRPPDEGSPRSQKPASNQ